MEYKNLLKPLVIGKTVLKNRLLSSNALPHFLQGPETWLNDPIMIYQANIAKNAAVVTIGSWTQADQHKGGRRGDSVHFPSFDMSDPSVDNSLALYCDVLHMYGTKATISLMLPSPSGYDVSDGPGGGGFMMGGPPGGAGDPNDDDTPPPQPFGGFGGGGDGPDEDMMKEMMERMNAPKKAITREMMDELIKKAIEDCKFWKDIGFDGISIHMAYQGPLCAKFLSPLTNKRTDEFGGSVENRARFPLMLCEAIKKELGEDFIIEALVSGKEAEGGITIEDTVAFAKLAEGKIDILQLRGGDGDEAHPTTFNSTIVPITLEVAEAVKKSGAKIVVAPIGGLQNAELAEQWIAEGKMDMMAAARAFVCEPDYVKKLQEGRGEDIIPCIRCNKCHGLSMNGPWISVCSVNPRMGIDHIADRLFQPAERVKNVAVIGAGPAGMYAAITLADRGHKVTVFERGSKPGGQLVHSDYASFKWTIKSFNDWLAAQCRKKGVELRLDADTSPEAIKAGGFDTVVAATGAEPNIPDIPGLTKADGSLADNVFTPMSVFGGADKLGQNVVVVGGSEIGCETGMYIAETGRNVTVVTRQSRLAPSAQRVHYGLPALGYHGLRQKLSCTTVKVEDGQITYVNYKGTEKTLPCDSVVISGGMNPRYEQALSYYNCAPEFYIAGDCAGNGDGSIQKALRSAYGVACQI